MKNIIVILGLCVLLCSCERKNSIVGVPVAAAMSQPEIAGTWTGSYTIKNKDEERTYALILTIDGSNSGTWQVPGKTAGVYLVKMSPGKSGFIHAESKSLTIKAFVEIVSPTQLKLTDVFQTGSDFDGDGSGTAHK